MDGASQFHPSPPQTINYFTTVAIFHGVLMFSLSTSPNFRTQRIHGIWYKNRAPAKFANKGGA
jgi:hypothetical protein